MQIKFMYPFIEALVNVLSTMAQTKITSGEPFIKKENSNGSFGDVSGIIGFTGSQAIGSLVISFSEPAILDIAKKIFGEEKTKIDEEIVDMVGEITNMVSGGGRMKLSVEGYKFESSIPSTITGKKHQISHKTSGETIVVPNKSDAGDIYIEVCFEDLISDLKVGPPLFKELS